MSGTGISHALIAERLFDGEHWHRDTCVLLEGERISAIVPRYGLPDTPPYPLTACRTLAPGFIDLQVNGGGGVLFNGDPRPETVRQMALGHRRAGTTAILPTLISDTPEVQRAGVEAVAAAIAGGSAGILGVHIEGPFFAPPRRGTHKADMIRTPDAADIGWLKSIAGFPVILTLAPEQLQPGLLEELTAADIIVCAGHTDATYDQIQAAIKAGLRGFTHLFNAMSPLQARAPGAVGAALEDTATWAGIIADGYHVHPATLRLAWRTKTRGKLFLVSDAMATVGSDDDGFDLYGERITVHEGKLINAEGVLAGSAIGLIDAVRTTHEKVGLPLDECLRMASLYPAEFLGVDDNLGRVRAGYRADLVHFDRHFTVLDTWVAGDHLRHSHRQPGTKP